jgi:hypothetical protein
MRLFELFCGILTGILGVAATLVWWMNLPINVAELSGITAMITPATIHNFSWGSSAFVYMALLGGLSLLVTIGSFFHALWESPMGRFLLWLGAGFLFLGTICAFGLGLLFWPSSFMGLLCSAAAVLGQKIPTRTRSRFPNQARV